MRRKCNESSCLNADRGSFRRALRWASPAWCPRSFDTAPSKCPPARQGRLLKSLCTGGCSKAVSKKAKPAAVEYNLRLATSQFTQKGTFVSLRTVVLGTTAAVFRSVDYGWECANGGWPIWSFQRLILIDFESRSAICMNVGQQPIKKFHYLFSLTIFMKKKKKQQMTNKIAEMCWHWVN